MPNICLHTNTSPVRIAAGVTDSDTRIFRETAVLSAINAPPSGGSFDLLMLVYGYAFTDAVRAVAGVLGMDGGSVAPAVARLPTGTAPKAADDGKKREKLKALWQACEAWDADTVIADYLHGRGIPLPESLSVSAALRFHRSLEYWNEGKMLGRFPAMVAAFQRPDGEPCGLHLTYLRRDKDGSIGKALLSAPKTGQPLPAKKMRNVGAGSLTGTAIRLFKPDDDGVLGVCEGIETAFAARYISGVPMWACGSAHGIQTVVLPEGLRHLVIVADNDANGTGIRAARALQRRYMREIDTITIWLPDTVGTDAADVVAALAAQVEKGR